MWKTIRKLFFDKTNNTWIQLFRSLFIGGIATIVDFGCTAIVRELIFGGEDTWKLRALYVCCGFIAGLLTNFALSCWFVFSKAKNTRREEFVTFTIIGVIGLLINYGIVSLFSWVLTTEGVGFYVAKIIATVVTFLWNFIARKKIICS